MSTYFDNDNVGITERVTRGVLGLALIEVILLVPAVSPAVIAALSMISFYMVFTGIIAWDPLNAVTKRFTANAPAGLVTTHAAHARSISPSGRCGPQRTPSSGDLSIIKPRIWWTRIIKATVLFSCQNIRSFAAVPQQYTPSKLPWLTHPSGAEYNGPKRTFKCRRPFLASHITRTRDEILPHVFQWMSLSRYFPIATRYRPKYTAVICSRSWPRSRLIVSRASRSICFCSGVSRFEVGPLAAGAGQPVRV